MSEIISNNSPTVMNGSGLSHPSGGGGIGNTGRVSPNPSTTREASLNLELCGFNENTWFGIGKTIKWNN